jgi:hypothetical protein
MATEDFKESLNSCLVHHVRDWAANKRDAWIWGIIVGWDDESMPDFKRDFGWDDEAIARLGRLRKQFEEFGQ